MLRLVCIGSTPVLVDALCIVWRFLDNHGFISIAANPLSPFEARMTESAKDVAVQALIKSRLRLKHFEIFRNVCELHTIRKAAAASNMTQPAATKLIHELEEIFRVVLFQRNRRGMQLTPPGEILRR